MRKVYTEDSATRRLVKNKVAVRVSVDPFSSRRTGVVEAHAGIGNKLWGAIDYLSNYHGYRVFVR